MKTKKKVEAHHEPTEAEIRACAHHLYVQSGWLPGRDLDNWLEAEALLKKLARRKNGRAQVPAQNEELAAAVGSRPRTTRDGFPN